MGRKVGISDEQLQHLADYRESDAFSPLEKLVIAYAEHISRTPVSVPDELFSELSRHFNAAQMIELTAAIAWENFLSRFNRAFGVEAQGFSEGAYCPLPERTAE